MSRSDEIYPSIPGGVDSSSQWDESCTDPFSRGVGAAYFAIKEARTAALITGPENPPLETIVRHLRGEIPYFVLRGYDGTTGYLNDRVGRVGFEIDTTDYAMAHRQWRQGVLAVLASSPEDKSRCEQMIAEVEASARLNPPKEYIEIRRPYPLNALEPAEDTPEPQPARRASRWERFMRWIFRD